VHQYSPASLGGAVDAYSPLGPRRGCRGLPKANVMLVPIWSVQPGISRQRVALKAALTLVYTVKDLARLRLEKIARRQGIHSTFKDSFKIRRGSEVSPAKPPRMSTEIGDGEASIWYGITTQSPLCCCT
jgi:hypothetical protein